MQTDRNHPRGCSAANRSAVSCPSWSWTLWREVDRRHGTAAAEVAGDHAGVIAAEDLGAAVRRCSDDLHRGNPHLRTVEFDQPTAAVWRIPFAPRESFDENPFRMQRPRADSGNRFRSVCIAAMYGGLCAGAAAFISAIASSTSSSTTEHAEINVHRELL